MKPPRWNHHPPKKKDIFGCALWFVLVLSLSALCFLILRLH